MKKYRRISSQVYGREKKKFGNTSEAAKPPYLGTKSLMEKMGIKLSNDEIYTFKNEDNTISKKQKDYNKKRNGMELGPINENEDDNNNVKNFKSKSLQKRDIDENFTKKRANMIMSSSYEKRNVKRPSNKQQDKKGTNIKEIQLPKEKRAKFKKSFDKADVIENNEIPEIKRKRTMKKEILKSNSKKENETKVKKEKIAHFKSINVSGNKSSQVQFKKISQLKLKENQNENRHTKSKSTYSDKGKINMEEDKEKEKEKGHKKKKSKKKKGKERKETDDDFGNEIRHNQTLHIDSIIDGKIFEPINNNNSPDHSLTDKKNKKNDDALSASASSDANSGDSSDDYLDKIPYREKRAATFYKKSNAKGRLAAGPKKPDKDEEEEKDKEYNNSGKKHSVELNSHQINNIKRSSKDDEDSKLTISKCFRRGTMDNSLMREKVENLWDEMVLKQNGGNSLFLKNYEKGPSYSKEIEILIKNQNVQKKIKISSYTKAGCSGPGIVKTNQDDYFIKENFLNNNNYFFLGICDGHGEKGELISKFVSNKLPEYIQDLNSDNIKNNFKKINNEIYNNKNIESNMSGTTVSSIILTPEKILSINVGDSRASLFKYENGLYSCQNLTRDHKPTEPDESRRIEFSNGRIKKCYDEDLKKYIGPERVWLKTKDEPGLAMSRSLGDKIAHTVGVIEEPELKNFEYNGNEKFIVIASDGIWEYLDGNDCIKIIKPCYEENFDPENAALLLVKEAFRKWKRKEVAIDDITVIVIFLYD